MVHAGGPGSIPGQGTRSHMSELRVCMLQLNKAMVFPVVMYGCESWTVKKAEHRRIDAFEVWCWKRLLRVPWTPVSSLISA